MNHQTFKERLEEIQKTALNDFYDYITEHDIIKVAEEYSNKTILKTSVESLITLFEDYTKAIVGEEEPLSSLEEWLEATKNYGGTEEEWWKLHSMHNTEENFRQTIIKSSKTILRGESDEL